MIAAVNGPAAGLGLIQALFCDVRFAASDAKLTTSFARLGLPAEEGLSWLLPRLVGYGRATDLLLSARVILGSEAERIGLVDYALPADEVLPGRGLRNDARRTVLAGRHGGDQSAASSRREHELRRCERRCVRAHARGVRASGPGRDCVSGAPSSALRDASLILTPPTEAAMRRVQVYHEQRAPLGSAEADPLWLGDKNLRCDAALPGVRGIRVGEAASYVLAYRLAPAESRRSLCSPEMVEARLRSCTFAIAGRR
jgi:enoyl-CoA hydratase/carnithine racemase